MIHKNCIYSVYSHSDIQILSSWLCKLGLRCQGLGLRHHRMLLGSAIDLDFGSMNWLDNFHRKAPYFMGKSMVSGEDVLKHPSTNPLIGSFGDFETLSFGCSENHVSWSQVTILSDRPDALWHWQELNKLNRAQRPFSLGKSKPMDFRAMIADFQTSAIFGAAKFINI